MRRVISVCLPTWSTDRLRRANPALPPAGSPLATAARDGSRRLITGACAAARAAGLHPGMPVAKANALVAGLTVVDADPPADRAGLHRLAVWAAGRWSPIAASDPPDGILLDATGCAHLFGGEGVMLERITSALARAGLTARAAMADTVGTAHALARYGGERITVVPKGEGLAALAPLPVAALRLDPEVPGELRRFGFRRIGQLLGEPRAPLVHRFGSDLARRLDQALGHAHEAITPVVPRSAPRRRRSFPDPLTHAEGLAQATLDLAGALCSDLTERGLGARCLDLLFERVDHITVALRIGLAQPSRDAEHLARLLVRRLDAVDPGFGVEAMVLVASHAEPLDARQLRAVSLQDKGTPAVSPDLAALVDRVGNLPQVARVFALAAVASDVPERAVQRLPALAGVEEAAGWPPELPRPYWLFPPERVEALALMPDAPPARFTWRARAYRVRRADGPERIHLEWWRRASEILALRDYYRVEDEGGGRYWLFRDARTNAPASWFIHGVFG